MTKRLTPKHPTYKKVEKIFDLMDKLDIRFEFDSNRMKVWDSSENPLREEYLPVLTDVDSGESVDQLPSSLEWVLIIED